MAWCRHCGEDRPIERQTFKGLCPYCDGGFQLNNGLSSDRTVQHRDNCRGSTIGCLDVCSFCHEPLFAKAKTLEEFVVLEEREEAMREALRNPPTPTPDKDGSVEPDAVTLGCVALLAFALLSVLLWGIYSVISSLFFE